MHISPPKTKKRDYVHMLARPNRGDMRSRRQFWPVRAVISDPAKKTPPGSNPTTRPRLVSSRLVVGSSPHGAPRRGPMSPMAASLGIDRPEMHTPCPILPTTTINIQQHMVCPHFLMEQNTAANQIKSPERLGFGAETLDRSSNRCEKRQAATGGLKTATRRESELGRNPSHRLPPPITPVGRAAHPLL